MTRPVEGAKRGRPRLAGDDATEAWALRLPSTLLARLHAQAKREGESPATVARQAIRAYLDRAEKRH